MAMGANTNQFTTTGFSYDASGNVLADGTNTYAWNAESQIKTATGVSYTYDGDGDRVQKSNGKIYWYGAGSEILDESDSSGNITDEYIFFGGKRIAHRVVSGNAIYYYAEDFLGSSRVMTTSTGTVCYDADFYPYGGERVVTNTCPQNYKFTGKERDAETNNDDFGARYYSSQFGRWISPDWSAIPEPVPYANLTNPQTLNLYAMVHDNPETFADLDGHCCDGMWAEAWAGVKPDYQQLLHSPRVQEAAKGVGLIVAAVATTAAVVSTAEITVPAGIAVGLGAPATGVAGVIKIAGAATGQDTTQAQKALGAVGTPAGLITTVVSGGNLNAGNAASAVQDVVTIAANPTSLASVAGAANAPIVAGEAVGLTHQVVNFFSSMTVPAPPPTPVPPPPPTPLKTDGAKPLQ
jgi:RHS repeat-associated protein